MTVQARSEASTRLVDWVGRWQEVGDGMPVIAPERNAVAAVLETAAAAPDLRLADGPDLTAYDVAVCAVMAGCPAHLAPLAFAAVRAVLRRPEHTLGLGDPVHPRSDELVHHPATVLSASATRSFGLWSGYGALSAPEPRLGPAVGRTVSLVLHLSLPAYRTNLPVMGHPGWYAYSVAEHPDLRVGARSRRPEEFSVASAAVSAPRGLYLGGASAQAARIGRIIADGLLTAVGPVEPAERAALLVVNPTTSGHLADARTADLVAVIAAEAERLRPGGADIVDRLDVLTVVAGGESQTWIAAAVGPPGSHWEFA